MPVQQRHFCNGCGAEKKTAKAFWACGRDVTAESRPLYQFRLRTIVGLTTASALLLAFGRVSDWALFRSPQGLAVCAMLLFWTWLICDIDGLFPFPRGIARRKSRE